MRISYIGCWFAEEARGIVNKLERGSRTMNTQKYETYKSIHESLSKALKYGFYYEAIFLEYAVIEDRLASVLKYAGILYIDKNHIGVRPHKEKINISKEIINKTRGAVAPYAAQIFTHLSVVSSRQRSYDWLRCEGLKNEMEM